MLMLCCYLDTGILLSRERMARLWCDHRAGGVYLGAYWKHAAWRRKSVDELSAAVKPAERKDTCWTCGVVQLLESAAGAVEHRWKLQHVGRRQRWRRRRSEIARRQRSRAGRWRYGRRHGHLWSFQLTWHEPQYLEPKQHERIVRYVRLDVQLRWTEKRQLVATAKEFLCSTQDQTLCYICFTFLKA